LELTDSLVCSEVIDALKQVDKPSGDSGARQWIYQTCSQFGFYQTCEDRSCIFSNRINIVSETRLCKILFGISPRSIRVCW
jgi:serine protease 16